MSDTTAKGLKTTVTRVEPMGPLKIVFSNCTPEEAQRQIEGAKKVLQDYFAGSTDKPTVTSTTQPEAQAAQAEGGQKASPAEQATNADPRIRTAPVKRKMPSLVVGTYTVPEDYTEQPYTLLEHHSVDETSFYKLDRDNEEGRVSIIKRRRNNDGHSEVSFSTMPLTEFGLLTEALRGISAFHSRRQNRQAAAVGCAAGRPGLVGAAAPVVAQ